MRRIILALVVAAVILGSAPSSSAEDCGWCWNIRYFQIFYVHEFAIGGGQQGDLACQGDGGGCHTSQFSGTCDENHDGCSYGPWVNFIDDAEDGTRSLLTLLDAGDVSGVRRILGEQQDILHINSARSALQLLSPCNGQVVLSLPAPPELLARLLSD